MFDVLVMDKANRYINGLTKTDFIVYEDNVEQQIGTLSVGDDTNLSKSIVLIIDYSGSETAFMAASTAAAKILVNQLGPNDRMAIVTDDVELICDYTRDKEKLAKVLDSLKDKNQHGHAGKSEQFSALMATLQEMIDPKSGRTIIIFQTDGDQFLFLKDQLWLQAKFSPFVFSDVEFGFADIQRKAEHTPATIYSIVPADQLVNVSPQQQHERGTKMYEQGMEAFLKSVHKEKKKAPNDEKAVNLYIEQQYLDQKALATIAATSGGWTGFLPTPDNAAGVYSGILSDINHRYIIGYYPTNTTRDGKRRNVRIEVRNHPEYVVLGKRSYYPSASSDQ